RGSIYRGCGPCAAPAGLACRRNTASAHCNSLRSALSARRSRRVPSTRSVDLCGRAVRRSGGGGGVEPSPAGDLVLVDAALRDGIAAARRTRQVKPDVRIIAYAVRETKEDVIAWAQAGVIGYVPDTAPLAELAASSW